MKQFPLLSWRSKVPVCVRGCWNWTKYICPCCEDSCEVVQYFASGCLYRQCIPFCFHFDHFNDGLLIAAHLFLVPFSLLPTFSWSYSHCCPPFPGPLSPWVPISLPLASPLSLGHGVSPTPFPYKFLCFFLIFSNNSKHLTVYESILLGPRLLYSL